MNPAFDELYALIAPDLDVWEQGVRASEPSLADAEVLDRALRLALAQFRHEAAQQTLTYLQWRVAQVRADTQATLAASAAARQARAAARAASTAPGTDDPDARPISADAELPLPRVALADDRPRTFRDRAGCTWSVHEVTAGAVPWAHGPRCLLFGSEAAIRRVWHYPADWRALTDAELEALSWRV